MGIDNPELEGRLAAIEHMLALTYNMMLIQNGFDDGQINAVEAHFLSATDQQTSEIHALGWSSDDVDAVISSFQNSMMTIQSRARSLRLLAARKP